ncbi:MAG: hypothetical protein H7232_13275 [Aeromicrobium sp.]|nr:hypothetical protein [Burkholderiales bacterium]
MHHYFVLSPKAATAAVISGIGICLLSFTANLEAKPIAFAEAVTMMHERDANMISTEVYYAPKHWWSLGIADLKMTSDDKQREMDSKYAQFNFLLKRWNMPGAQGNIFASAGFGWADSVKQGVMGVVHPGHSVAQTARYSESARRFVLQGDYETRQFYSSLKFDVQQTPLFYERTDTGQIGFSPVAHDYEDLAVWFVAQVKKYRGMSDKTEAGAFVRLFKKNIWVEIGVTEGRKPQMMLMVNY